MKQDGIFRSMKTASAMVEGCMPENFRASTARTSAPSREAFCVGASRITDGAAVL